MELSPEKQLIYRQCELAVKDMPRQVLESQYLEIVKLYLSTKTVYDQLLKRKMEGQQIEWQEEDK